MVIGLEVHCQLKTRTKLFCACPNRYGADPNTLVCPVCLGLPGALPVLNRTAFELAIRTGLALGCEVAAETKFDRKNYFYPDLSKGYQISQFDRPLNRRGALAIDAPGGKMTVGITRAHLEEDAGKLIHADGEEAGGFSFVDFNRCGVPLVEIVSEPDMRTPEEAYAYLMALKSLLEYVEVSDCDMEKGSLRCDANISIRRPGAPFGTRTEIKNLNSFKAVAKAIEHEAHRHAGILEAGGRIEQMTLTWDAVAEKTLPLRSKEDAHDYRYFPEPDLVPVTAPADLQDRIRAALPEPPAARRERYVRELGLPPYDAGVLTADKAVAELFDRLRAEGLPPKVASNWVMSRLLAVLNDRKLGPAIFLPKVTRIADIAKALEAKTITNQVAGELLAWVLDSVETETVAARIASLGLAQVSDAGALEAIVREVVARNPKIVADYRGGKPSAVQALVGQVMKDTKGKANATVARELLLKVLG
ncbi:MAG: Asp-tRNA(Asn)/Glu-tRNA(Gln) amidotransferase subunit GatB [Candidatus Brocadiae bacterium]|nr:Asp-tRNA(Asn)/Glu-tRNA(Gln) amidotransferase subunit GatB [Candidatus Brocadiia bacterium]